MENQKTKAEVPRVMLGSQGLEVSKLGFGCLNVAGEDGIAIIKHAFSKGVTFFDTADIYGSQTSEILVGKVQTLNAGIYGSHTSEILLGKALKELPREKIQVCTKFGIQGFDATSVMVKGTPEYVRACCEASLERLGLDYIDLYYQHRVDLTVPIEDTMSELKKLVEEGKVKYIGLSEAGPNTIRRAHAVHPITAVQMEWSLWTRDIEEEIVPLCRELGIGIVPYSPLGLGFFAGKASKESLPADSLLNYHPKFSGENLEHNKVLYTCLENLAAKHSCTPAQLALAWLLHQGNDVVPIPGTTKIKNLNENIGSVSVQLTVEDLKEISHALSADKFAGERGTGVFSPHIWQLAITPEKDKNTPPAF